MSRLRAVAGPDAARPDDSSDGHQNGDPDPVRVAFVSSHAQLGGGESYLRSIVEGVGASWTSALVSLHDGPFVARLREGGHDVAVLPSRGRWSIPSAARRLRRHLRDTRTEVIHANGIKAALVSVLATFPHGPPVLWLKYDFGWDGWLASLVARRCRLIVGISAAVNETLGPRFAARTRVVYAGIPDFPEEVGRGREVLYEALGGDPRGPVVVLSGRLCPGKGQLDMISAMPVLLERVPDASLVLLGVEDSFYPDYRHELEVHAEALGVTTAVRFSGLAGHQAAAAVAAVSAADVLVQPSRLQERGGWKEGFGLAVVEAMYVGTPVVVYANGALPEVVGPCGVVVDEGDVQGLGRAVAALLTDPQRREQLGRDGRARARERYRLDRVVSEMSACYRELAAGR